MNIDTLVKAMSGRAAIYIILLAVLYGVWTIANRALDSFAGVSTSIDVLSKNVDELRIGVIRMGDSMQFIKEKVKDHEDRIRSLEEQKRERRNAR
jgi:hypothetical protein